MHSAARETTEELTKASFYCKPVSGYVQMCRRHSYFYECLPGNVGDVAR